MCSTAFLPLTVVFVPSRLPGPIVRAIENAANGKRSAFASPQISKPALPAASRLPLFLNGPPLSGEAQIPWRVLFADTDGGTDEAAMTAHRFLYRLGPELSRKLASPVFAVDVSSNGVWRATHWEAGVIANSDESAFGSAAAPLPPLWLAFLQRGSRLHIPASLRAWAREKHLPLSDAPLGRSWKRGANVVDYDSVAGLERKGLLVETNRVWYRIAVDVPLGKTDGGIMEA